MYDDKTAGAAVGFGLFLCFMLGAILGMGISHHFTEETWQTELIRRNQAEYNTTTGNWQWKNEPLIESYD